MADDTNIPNFTVYYAADFDAKKEKNRQYRKAYYYAHRDEILKYQKAYRDAHREELIKRKKENSKKKVELLWEEWLAENAKQGY
ncbi:MAG TPA: hypothetical protein O0X39_04470 [Methanocorpusculum sp.]|nr:hypothetical protein [Methanocorpusculum sp.]